MEQKIKKSIQEFAQQIEVDLEADTLSENDLLNKWTNKFIELNNLRRNKTEKISLSELLNETIQIITDQNNSKNLFSNIPSGFNELDKLIGGFPLGELVIIGARPAMGKTAFLLSIVSNSIINQNSKIAYFSLEMSQQQILMRLLANISGFSFPKLASKDLNEVEIEQLKLKSNIFENAKFIIEDSWYSIDDIIFQTDYLVKEKGVQLIMIDYLQLIRSGNKRDSREQELARVCRGLKNLARKHNIAILVNSQLSRAVEVRGGYKIPILSDLRESGAIEQDADKVFFIHRPEYYDITEDIDGNKTRGIAEIIIAKNRSGPVASAKLMFVNHLSAFKDLDAEKEKKNNWEENYFTNIRKNEFRYDNEGNKKDNTGWDETDAPF